MKKRILLQIEEDKDNLLSFQTNKLTTIEVLGLCKYFQEIEKTLLEELK